MQISQSTNSQEIEFFDLIKIVAQWPAEESFVS